MKAWVEIGEVTQKIIEWLSTGDYKRFVEASVGETKDAGFRAACMLLPSILLTKCNVTYEQDN